MSEMETKMAELKVRVVTFRAQLHLAPVRSVPCCRAETSPSSDAGQDASDRYRRRHATTHARASGWERRASSSTDQADDGR